MPTKTVEVTCGPDPIVCGANDGNPADVFLKPSPHTECCFCRSRRTVALGRRVFQGCWLPTICKQCAERALKSLSGVPV